MPNPKIQAMKLTMLEEPYRNLMPFYLGFIGLVIGGILTTFLLGQRLKIQHKNENSHLEEYINQNLKTTSSLQSTTISNPSFSIHESKQSY